MLIIPIADRPAQSLKVSLGGQSCQIEINQKSTGLFLSLYVNDAPIVLGVACRNGVRMVREAYRGFVGDLAFADTQGASDPSYPGLGDRFALAYLEPADLA